MLIRALTPNWTLSPELIFFWTVSLLAYIYRRITETCLDHEAVRECVLDDKISFYKTCLFHFLGSVHTIFFLVVEFQRLGDVKRVYTPSDVYLLHPLYYR